MFKEKCAGIYLNAVAGSPETKEDEELEYNVRLNAVDFAAIWEIQNGREMKHQKTGSSFRIRNMDVYMEAMTMQWLGCKESYNFHLSGYCSERRGNELIGYCQLFL